MHMPNQPARVTGFPLHKNYENLRVSQTTHKPFYSINDFLHRFTVVYHLIDCSADCCPLSCQHDICQAFKRDRLGMDQTPTLPNRGQGEEFFLQAHCQAVL